ncbi:MAG: hypothetical protein MJ175_08370 [Clostridia bacterium]|nr:hypothetical protein [Clostridia bacterium]
MSKNQKLLSALCASVILLSAVSCGAQETPETPVTPSTGGNDTAAVTEAVTEAPRLDELPDDLNFNGAAFTMLTFDQNSLLWARCLLDTETTSGDLINDAIFYRNRAVENRLNVTIRQTEQTYGASYLPGERAMIMSGDETFQVGLDFAPNVVTLASEGLLLDMNKVPHVDLSKAYWCKSLNDSLSISGCQYLTAGDFSLCSHDSTSVLLFNKKMPAQFDLEEPYSLVKSGKWTIEKFREYGMNAVADINGDGKMDDQDSYGFSAVCKQILPCMWVGSGELSVRKDKDDVPYLSAGSDNHFTEVFNKIMDTCWNNNFWYAVPINDATTGKTSMQLFADGQAFFSLTTLFSVETLRDNAVDFGIIPFPKYEESQKDYYSRIASLLMCFVPSTISDPDMVGACLEALCSESHASLIPTYYDVMLGSKLSRDEESVEMLDIIFANRVCDHGDLTWCPLIRDGIMGTMMEKNDRNLESQVAKAANNIDKQITTVVDSFNATK